MVKEKIVNIPNVLSFYRILIFPVILWFIIDYQVRLFAIFLCVNILTDFLDGQIARRFNMVTNFGARLDSLADYGTLFLAFFGIISLKSDDLATHGWFLYIYICLMVLVQVVSIIRFRSLTSFHLYSFRLTGYLLGPLFFFWFFVRFYPWLFYLALGLGVLAEIETLIILFLMKERVSNAKGLYWVLKNKHG
jgi:cardiolipin synthase (CMP-forming)